MSTNMNSDSGSQWVVCYVWHCEGGVPSYSSSKYNPASKDKCRLPTGIQDEGIAAMVGILVG